MRRLAPIVVLLLAVLPAAWLALGSIVRPAPLNEPARGCAEQPPQKPQRAPLVGTNAKPLAPGDEPVAEPADKKDTDPHAPAIEDEPAPPLHTPDYGPLLKRAGGRAVFRAEDARGRPVDPGDFSYANLWRKLGSFYVQEGAHFDRLGGGIVCSGYGGQENPAGLEPGEYELEVSFKGCGSSRREFSIAPGEHATDIITLPNWARRICLRFVDQHGAPVPFLYQGTAGLPAVWCQSEPAPGRKRPSPPEVLRVPPSPLDGTSVGLGGRGGRGNGMFGYRDALIQGRIPLEAGRLYLDVYAGASNTITIPFDKKIWGTETLTLRDTCTGPEWDDYVIRLNLPEDFLQRLEAREGGAELFPVVRLNERESDHTPGIKPGPPPDPHDLTRLKEGTARVVLRTRRDDLTPIVRVGDTDNVAVWRIEQGWVFEVPADSRLQVGWTDGGMLHTAPAPLALEGRRLLETDANVLAAAVTVRTEVLSHTGAAFGHRLQLKEVKPSDPSFRLSPGRPVPWTSTWTGLSTIARRDGYCGERDLAGFVFRSLLEPASARACANAKWTFHALAAESWPSLELAAVTADTADFNFKLKPAADTLLLRAVGAAYGGLPWVRAALVPRKQDKLTRELREISRKAAAGGGKAPALPKPPKGELPDDFYLVGNEASEDDLRLRMGESYHQFRTRAQREFFCRNGAWYDTRRTLRSDIHGYMIAQGLRLEPGEHYVLYLWSASRDDNEPDLRLDFVASKDGATDLGVVMLPDYR